MTTAEREMRIRHYLPLVRQIARRVARVVTAADFDDLVGDGSIGLIRAVDGFDQSRGTSLETYARKLIAGAMLNGLRRLDPVSERVRRRLRRADEKRFALAQQLGTLPTFATLERGDAPLRRARAAAARQAALSLDAPLSERAQPPLDWQTDPAYCVAEDQRRAALNQAIALLPERERRILSLHYSHDLTLHAISRALAVSPQRVSQLHLSALARLRQTAIRA